MLAFDNDFPLKGYVAKLTGVIACVEFACYGRYLLAVEELLNMGVLFTGIADDGQTLEKFGQFSVC